MSECLVTGFHTQGSEDVLCVPNGDVPLGTRLLQCRRGEAKRETLRSIAQAAITQTMELSKVLTSEQMDKLQKLS